MPRKDISLESLFLLNPWRQEQGNLNKDCYVCLLMEAYIFLFVLAGIWIIFASIQDLKTREVANWLTFSLVAFALAYRGFLSIISRDFGIILWGLIGALVFIGLAHIFYYGRVFAGGDAKLLMGVGITLPYSSFSELLYWSIVFIATLFFLGAIYSIIYSLFLVMKRFKEFKPEFIKEFRRAKWLFLLAFVLSGILLAISPNLRGIFGVLMIFGVVLLYSYLQAVEKVCFIVDLKPNELSEGDWLVKNVKVNGKVINADVHGLSLEDIKILKKNGKNVRIKQGVPFVPAFLLAYIAMVLFYSFSELLLPESLSSLF